MIRLSRLVLPLPFQIAENYAQSGQVSPSKTIEYAKKACWDLDDPIKRAQLFVYWGDAVQLSKSRKEATKVYLRGLAFCLKYNLPTKEPELPTFNRVRYSGPPEEAEKIRSESNRQMAARNHAKLTGNLIQHRQALTGQIIQLYAKSPDAFDELHQLAMHYLASEPAAQQLITAAKAYRTNHKTPFPVITKNFRAPKPKPDSSWDKTIDGAQVRLRTNKL